MIWNRVKNPFDELKRSEPGRRFQEFHHRRCGQCTRAMSAARMVAGVVLVFGGIVLSMPPLVPGFIVTVVGLTLIAAQSQRVARWMDGMECWLRRSWDGT